MQAIHGYSASYIGPSGWNLFRIYSAVLSRDDARFLIRNIDASLSLPYTRLTMPEEAPSLASALKALEEVKVDANKETLGSATEESLFWILSQTCSHYFCPGEDEASQQQHAGRYQIAVFLLRLSQFKSKNQIAQWKDRVDSCLTSCVKCVEGYHRGKALYIST